MADDKHIVRTAGFDWSQGWRGRHPFNPASEMALLPLGATTGLKRLGVNLIRIPPGKESFIPHAHSMEEEFIFVLEGAGEVVLDGVGHAVGPGDFVGFPTDGVVHSLVSKGPAGPRAASGAGTAGARHQRGWTAGSLRPYSGCGHVCLARTPATATSWLD